MERCLQMILLCVGVFKSSEVGKWDQALWENFCQEGTEFKKTSMQANLEAKGYSADPSTSYSSG